MLHRDEDVTENTLNTTARTQPRGRSGTTMNASETPEKSWGTVDTGGKRVIILVTGAGRSGTSTVTGTLKYLGVKVPEPEVRPNESNPRGFFEPKWVVDRHKKLLGGASVRSLDGEPGVPPSAIRKTAARTAFLRELRTWIASLPGDQNIFVVKDPRTVWAAPLWAGMAKEHGFEVRYLTMLRHPAAVLGSRLKYYHDSAGEKRLAGLAASQLSGWVHVNLVNAEQTRGSERTFVVYDELLSDWRATMQRVEKDLGIVFSYDLASTEPHEVDTFIEPGLRRVQATWEGTQAPRWLCDLADDNWEALVRRAHGQLDEDEFDATIDDLRAEYDSMYEAAWAVVEDRTRRKLLKETTRVRRETLAEASENGALVTKVGAGTLVAELRRRANRRARRVLKR